MVDYCFACCCVCVLQFIVISDYISSIAFFVLTVTFYQQPRLIQAGSILVHESFSSFISKRGYCLLVRGISVLGKNKRIKLHTVTIFHRKKYFNKI